MTTTTTTNNNVLDILNAKVAAAKASVMDSTLQSLADNEVFVQTLAKQQLKADGVTGLKTLVSQIDALTEAKSRLFGYGEGIDLIIQLASGWLYSKAEVKPLIEAIIPSLAHYAEDLMVFVGKLPYYSKTLSTVMDGEPMDVDTFKSLVLALATELNIYIEVSQLNDKHVNSLYSRATFKAELAFKEAKNTDALRQNALDL